MPGARGYVAERYALELEGVDVGPIRSAAGGDAVGDIVVEAPGPDFIRHKHIGGVRYTDIVVQAAAGIDKSLLKWLSDTAAGNASRKDGSVREMDYDAKERARLLFKNGLITEITFPALDAASKDAAYLTIGITPEQTVRSKGSGAKATYAVTKASKKWLPANFRLSIPGLDCTRVNKVSAISVKQRVVESAIGELRDYERQPAALEVSDVLVTLPDSYADGFYTWHEDFVIKGNSSASNEKTGTLEYLAADLGSTVFTLTLHNLGIYKVGAEPASSGEQIRRVTAAMYCERVEIAAPASAAASAATNGSAAAEAPARMGAELPLVEGPELLATAGPLVTHLRRTTS